MSIFRNVVVVLRGSLVAQIISFAILPILARLYPPDAFGRYQIFLSVMSFLLLAASLRYELAILNADTDECAFSLARLCLIINAAFAALAFIFCAALYLLYPNAVARLGQTLWVLPPVLLVGGAFQTLTYLLLRFHAFKEGSAARGIQAIGSTGTALTLGWLKVTSIGLVAADLTARALALWYAYGRMVVKDPRYRLYGPQTLALPLLLRKFRAYPLVTLPGSLLNGAGGILTPMLMFGVFGAATSGQYALVERCVAVPIAVISQAVSQVYMASFSSALRTNSTGALDLFKKIVFAHLKLGLLPAVVLLIFGRQLFELAFGERWAPAGTFAQIMAPMLLASFLVGPVDMTLQMLSKQKLNFVWHAFRLALVLSGWTIVSLCKMPPLTAIWMHSTVNVITYLTLLLIIYKSVLGERESARWLPQ